MGRTALVWIAPLACACSGGIGGDDASSGGAQQPDYLPADGVTIQQISVYQAVERVLMKDGAPANGVPMVAGRPALLRVFYATAAPYDGGPVVGRLTVGDGPPVDKVGALVASSQEKSLGSTIDFEVPAEAVTPAATFRVDILRAPALTSGQNTAATYPKSGQQSFGAVSTGAKLKLVLVPVRYDADGSGRLPDTSPAQLQRYHDALYKVYPVRDVDVRVAGIFAWNKPVTGNGNGWAELLNAVTQLRATLNAANDEYYYGIFAGADTFGQFCGQGCLAGLSKVVDNPFQAWQRAGIGIGYSGQETADTIAHEIGHEHGRHHAPCGTGQGLDSSFPYQGGVTGSWGYDLLGQSLQAPTLDDFMSYCGPKWISDYNYGALLTRSQAVNAAMELVAGPAVRYEHLAVLPDGHVDWLEPLDLDVAPMGQPEPVHVETAAGPLDVMGQFFPYSHLPGGQVLFAAPAPAVRAIVRGRPAQR